MANSSARMKALFCCVMMLLAVAGFSQAMKDLRLVKKVADKIIADTRFECKQVPQVPVLGIEIIDAGFLKGQNGMPVYAWRKAAVERDTVVRFGINSTAPVSVWVNNQLVYQ